VYTESYASGSLRAERAFADLKHRLLVGDFPLKTRLGEEKLATLLGVSRTPVREALHRLHAEGLVRRFPDGGYEPVAPDVGRMRHLYEVRSRLELAALQRPGLTGEPHDRHRLGQLRSEWLTLADAAPEADPSFVLLDESFHITLAEAAGNPELADVLRQVNERIRLVRMQDFLTTERVRQTVVEHIGIVEAVLDADLVEAERRFSEHLDQSIAVVEERVTRAITRMLCAGGQP
jgi:DNA-binding GntR family transcriptional regulator